MIIIQMFNIAEVRTENWANLHLQKAWRNLKLRRGTSVVLLLSALAGIPSATIQPASRGWSTATVLTLWSFLILHMIFACSKQLGFLTSSIVSRCYQSSYGFSHYMKSPELINICKLCGAHQVFYRKTRFLVMTCCNYCTNIDAFLTTKLLFVLVWCQERWWSPN